MKRADTGSETSVGFEFEGLGSDRIEPVGVPDRVENAPEAAGLGEVSHDFPDLAGGDELTSPQA